MKHKKWLILGGCVLLVTLAALAVILRERSNPWDAPACGDPNADMKPVIYLYPEETMDVSVSLDYDGVLTTTYPAYGESGWSVTAMPDGTLINREDGKEYSYLFWEGESDVVYDMTHGYVVKGADTAAFLQATLSRMGLIPREYNEFIVFWLPRMEKNPFNLITFQTKRYTDNAKLSISPKPDSVLRVFMAYRALDEWVEVEAPAALPQFERKGFTAVEWGGCEVQ